MRFKKTLTDKLSTKYLLIIRNEENFAEKTSLSFTYSKVILVGVLVFVAMLGISLLLVNTLLNQWFDPRHARMETNKKLVTLSMKIDSLEYEMHTKELFIQNFQRILTGDSVLLDGDRRKTEESTKTERSTFNPAEIAEIDSQFREEFEASGVSLANLSVSNTTLQEIFFYSPLTGFVSDRYDAVKGHYGVDVVTKKNEPVKCVADGTVIFASWTQDTGYVIAIHHRGNLVSVYKHNAEILKKVGTFVSGGEIISIVGNTGELTDGPHLHFELWSDGSPLNPEDFVSF